MIYVEAVTLGFDGVTERVPGSKFNLHDSTIPGRPAWFVGIEAEDKAKLEANQIADDARRAQIATGLARRASDKKLPATVAELEALLEKARAAAAVKSPSLAELQTAEVKVEKGTDAGTVSDLV